MGNILTPECSVKGCYLHGKYGYSDLKKFQLNPDYIVCHKHKTDDMVQYYCKDCSNIAKYGVGVLGSIDDERYVVEAIYCEKHNKQDSIYQLVRCLSPRCLYITHDKYDYCKYHLDENINQNI